MDGMKVVPTIFGNFWQSHTAQICTHPHTIILIVALFLFLTTNTRNPSRFHKYRVRDRLALNLIVLYDTVTNFYFYGCPSLLCSFLTTVVALFFLDQLTQKCGDEKDQERLGEPVRGQAWPHPPRQTGPFEHEGEDIRPPFFLR